MPMPRRILSLLALVALFLPSVELRAQQKIDVPVTGFFDNAIIERLTKEGFIDRLYKEGGK